VLYKLDHKLTYGNFIRQRNHATVHFEKRKRTEEGSSFVSVLERMCHHHRMQQV